MATQITSEIKSYHLIFNPVSGSGDPGTKLTEIQSALQPSVNLTTHLTKADVEVETIAQQAIAAGADVLIAAGGDGTVSGIASVLVNTDIPLGIIPTGTANAFASALGIPEEITTACEIIQAGHGQRVDTARCNDRMMLLAAAIGFEANLLTRMDREEKNRWGKLAIVTNSLRELQEMEQFKTYLETSEGSWNEVATAVTIANATTVSMILAHGPDETAADDGTLGITLVMPEHEWGLLQSAADLFLSGLLERPVQQDTVHGHKATQATIKTDPPQTVFVDGEPAGQTPVKVECYPRSLTVLTPAAS